MIMFKKKTWMILGVILMLFTVMPMMAGTVFASENKNPVVKLGTNVLKTGVNTDNAQTVYYGINKDEFFNENPVAWRVISYDGTGNQYTNPEGVMTLFASDNLNNGIFFNSYDNLNNDYAGSYLKSVLDDMYNGDNNGMYHSLFSDQEKSAIKTRTLLADEYIDEEPYSTGVSGATTSGYLWPLSTAEARSLPSDTFRSSNGTNKGDWWLRSPGSGDDSGYAAYVTGDGSVVIDGFDVYNCLWARPAFNMNLSSVLFTSAAAGGKSAGAAGTDSLSEISDNSTSEWKMTVHDSSRDGFAASVTTGAVLSKMEGYDSWSVPITYKIQTDSPPPASEKDYVSVILADSKKNALYYGNIDKKNFNGTKDVTIPAGLSAGEYKLHVFSEEINGDYLTDYSSAFSTIDLTVTAPPEPIKTTIPTGKTLTYNGESQTGVEAGTGYTLSGTTSAVNAGSYQATATLDEGYIWVDGTSEPKTISWKINKAAAKVTAPTGRIFTYNGKSRTGVASGSNYTLSGTAKAAKAGNYTAKATLKTNANYTYKWTDGTTAAKTIKWTINKAANTFRIKAGTATVKYSAVKKKNQVLGVTKVITLTSKGQGAKSYIKLSGNKKITIARTTGKVTVNKGLKKGTCKVKVKVKAAGNANYKASAWKTVTFTVKVK